MPYIRRKNPYWSGYSYEKILDLRFVDLNIKLSDTSLMSHIYQLYEELECRGIKFKPHCWLSDEWFSPDKIPGIAIPFYLAHAKLIKLEAQQVFEVEGGTERSCMRLLRHEAGHAISTAYQLSRRKKIKRVFGDFNKKYPDHYRPNPKSKNYVMHLDWWYAQSHPAEDFAETFAVWLKPRSRWRTEYKDWAVLKKLNYMDELMETLVDRKPLNTKRKFVDPISKMKSTLRDHYDRKRSHYGVNVTEVYDNDLIRLFRRDNGIGKYQRSAATFLKKHHNELCDICARGTGMYPYDIAQILQDMMVRCKEIKLKISRYDENLKTDVAIFIVLQSLNYRQRINHRIAI
jgi:hypothetical protein